MCGWIVRSGTGRGKGGGRLLVSEVPTQDPSSPRPSSPIALPPTGRRGRKHRAPLLQIRLPVLPIDGAQAVRDLAEGDFGADAVEDGRHEVAVLLRRGGEGGERRGGLLAVASLSQGAQALHLVALGGGIDAQDLPRHLDLGL